MSEAAAEETVDFSFELTEREVVFDLDEELYPRDAIYGAAYLFIDRCYVFLSRPADAVVKVRLRTRTPKPEAELEALGGEFANELLNQLLRLRIGRATARIRETYITRAFFADEPDSTIADLLAELDAEELEEDPLEIQVPWETAQEQPDEEQPDKEQPAQEQPAKSAKDGSGADDAAEEHV